MPSRPHSQIYIVVGTPKGVPGLNLQVNMKLKLSNRNQITANSRRSTGG